MAYTPINWDELTPINPANLNKMDNEIDSNESRVTTAESEIDSNDNDIATLDGRVDSNDSEINQIDSNHDGVVDNADKLNGKSWVTIASGSTTEMDFNVYLGPGGSHVHYNFSVYSPTMQIDYGSYQELNLPHTWIARSPANGDILLIRNNSVDDIFYYEVWAWE